MAVGQSAFAEPMTMQEALAKADSLYETKEAEADEAAQEPQDDEIEEIEASDEVEDLETDDTDEPEDEGSEQVLTVDEYGDVLVDLNGTPTPLKDVIQGTLRQADYTRKTQAVQEERKAMQAELEKREKALEAREQQLLQLSQELEEPEPDWEKLADEDPLGYPAAKAKWDKKQRQKAERQRALRERTVKQREAFARQTAEIAMRAVPEWSEDPANFDKGAEARKRAALDAGFSEEEYNSTPDFRIAVLLEKAARWDAMQQSTEQKRVRAEKKLGKAPKVLKPGQSRGDSDPKQERRAAFQKRLSKPISSAEITRSLGLR